MCDTNDQAGPSQSSSAAELLRSAVWSDLAYGGVTLPPVPRVRGASASNAKGGDTATTAGGGTAGRRATVGTASAAGTAGHGATTAAASTGTDPGRPFLPGFLAFAQLQAPAAAAASSYAVSIASQHNRCVCRLSSQFSGSSIFWNRWSTR
jgi:hypothetical protein